MLTQKRVDVFSRLMNQKKLIQNKHILAIVGLFSLFVLARFIPHPPNFSPITAVAFCSGIWFLRKSWLFLIPFAVLYLTDFYYGLYDGIAFTYFAYILIFSLGALFSSIDLGSKVLNAFSFLAANISASVIFFAVSNIGVWWATPLYTFDLQGLVECFVLAIPFYPNTLMSQIIYATVIQLSATWLILPAIKKHTSRA